ncbi:MAG: hypothetical protein HYY07_03660 [Elusimicrobia bacterium]|nr:hypothetical protein [Elusimicrobiota bacterium]
MAISSKFRILTFLFWFCSGLHAKPNLEFSGYTKNLTFQSRAPLTKQSYWQNLDRVRLTLDGAYTVFRGHLDYDHEVYTGTYLQTQEFKTFGVGEPPSFWKLDREIGQSGDYFWRHRIYRGWGGLEFQNGVFRFGYQRIAWGSGKLWNPTDVLNPYIPFSLEGEERKGVSSAYWRNSLGSLSQMETVFALSDIWKEQALLARIKSHAGRVDYGLMGGKISGQEKSWIVGGEMVMDVGDGALHSEISLTDPISASLFHKFLVGYEEKFPQSSSWLILRDLWIILEYYHNGAGARDANLYNFSSLLTGRETTLSQDYLGLNLSKEVHPLVRLDFSSIYNILDESMFLRPSLDWNMVENLHASIGWFGFYGNSISEFGRFTSFPHLQIQYFF